METEALDASGDSHDPAVLETDQVQGWHQPLAPLQLELLEVIWEPVGRAAFAPAQPTWPVWNYVERTIQARHRDLDSAVDVLNSLPRHELPAPQRSHPYGLVWGNQHPSVEPGAGDFVGLSVAGLFALARAGKINPEIPDRFALIIAQLANLEVNIEAPPDKVADENRPLSMFTQAFTVMTQQMPLVIPDRITARLLNAEYAPIFVSRAQEEDGHEVTLGRSRLRRYRNIRNAADYLALIEAAEAEHAPVQRHQSPLTLVQTMDYLSLTLASDRRWDAGKLIQAPDLRSAAAASALVTTQSEYESALSGLCTLLDQMHVPERPAAELDTLPNDEARRTANATVNRLESWLFRRLDGVGNLERVRSALQVVRDVRTLRVESQHRHPDNQRRARTARQRLGLPEPVWAYETAWLAITTQLAGALDVIREEVRSALRD